MNDNAEPLPLRLKQVIRGWLKRLQKEPDDKQQLTEILRDAEKHNLIKPDALTMMEGALQITEMQVREIMVPRSQMVGVLEEMGLKEFLPIMVESGHSRFPMMDEKHETVIGILLAKDVLACVAENGMEAFNVRDILRQPIFVPESKRLNSLLGEFRRSRNHMAIVIDEYGGIAGLVTIEDVIEQVVGEIDDEHDLDDEEFVRQQDEESYTVKAQMPLDEFNEYFETTLVDDENETIGGVVVDAFGHLPKRDETISFSGYDFKVLRADRRRIITLGVKRIASDEQQQQQASNSNDQSQVSDHDT